MEERVSVISDDRDFLPPDQNAEGIFGDCIFDPQRERTIVRLDDGSYMLPVFEGAISPLGPRAVDPERTEMIQKMFRPDRYTDTPFDLSLNLTDVASGVEPANIRFYEIESLESVNSRYKLKKPVQYFLEFWEEEGQTGYMLSQPKLESWDSILLFNMDHAEEGEKSFASILEAAVNDFLEEFGIEHAKRKLGEYISFPQDPEEHLLQVKQEGERQYQAALIETNETLSVRGYAEKFKVKILHRSDIKFEPLRPFTIYCAETKTHARGKNLAHAKEVFSKNLEFERKDLGNLKERRTPQQEEKYTRLEAMRLLAEV